MRVLATVPAVMLLLALLASGANCAVAQNDESSAPVTGNASVIAGHPFTATQFSRRVRVQQDGKLQFIRNEHYPGHLARDSEGRVRVEIIDDPPSECNRPELKEPPPCPAWGVSVFDLVTQFVIVWPAGEIGAHIAITRKLTPDEASVVEAATSEMPDLAIPARDLRELRAEGARIRTEKLGEKEIDGVLASGVRTTIVLPPDSSGRAPATRIHEVWTSPEMRLVLRVIDGDPAGEEVISGLEHISLVADASLFQPPEGYQMQHTSDREAPKSFEDDARYIGEWFVP